jgi:hypothetical protein
VINHLRHGRRLCRQLTIYQAGALNSGHCMRSQMVRLNVVDRQDARYITASVEVMIRVRLNTG